LTKIGTKQLNKCVKPKKNPMKITSIIMSLVFAVITLTACENQGVGPSKPASTKEAK
jgi:uncharacterized protein (DUF2062 family)